MYFHIIIHPRVIPKVKNIFKLGTNHVILCYATQNKTKQSISKKKCAKSQDPKIPNCDFEMLISQNNIDNTNKN